MTVDGLTHDLSHPLSALLRVTLCDDFAYHSRGHGWIWDRRVLSWTVMKTHEFEYEAEADRGRVSCLLCLASRRP